VQRAGKVAISRICDQISAGGDAARLIAGGLGTTAAAGSWDASRRRIAMNDDETRKSAYAKWEAEGRPEGHHDRHWFEAEQEVNGSHKAPPQTWSSDHDGGVSPPAKIERASTDDTDIEEPANTWPAAEEDASSTKS
jgi:hypothetical protein